MHACMHAYIHTYIHTHIHKLTPPNGPTVGGSRVLARSREKQQNKKLTKTKKTKNQKKQKKQPKNNQKKPKTTKKTKMTIFSKTKGLGPPACFGFLEKTMVFLVRNHLFLEKKMVLPGEDLQKPSFSREKDGFEPKKHLFLAKTQKNQKTIFWRPQPHSFGKDVFFFGFSREKHGFFGSKPFFLEKKMVLSNHPSKNYLSREKDGFTSPRKDGFEPKKPSFSRENQKNHLLAAPAP